MTSIKRNLLKKIGPAIDDFTASNTRAVVLKKIAELMDETRARTFFEHHWLRWYRKKLPSSVKVKSKLEHQNIMVAGQERFIVGFQFSDASLKKIVALFNFGRHKIGASLLERVHKQNPALMPRPLDFPEKQILMREFSPGKSLHKIIKKGELTNTHLKAAAELFHQLHQIKNFSAFPSKNPILEFLSVNLKRSKRLNPVLYPILEDLRKRSMKVIKKSERKSITLCHGDLTPSNIIFDNKKAQLIDWDLAHKNEPVYDLAYFSAHLVDTMTIKEVSERKILAARNAFLKAYHASFSKKRFLAWETLTLVVATDHLLQSYCYDHMKKRIDFMLKMAEQSILLCEKIKS